MNRMGWITAELAERAAKVVRNAALGGVLLLGGCAADTLAAPPPDATVELEETAERDAWEQATPGCEDVAGDDLRVVACEGESELGCIVDLSGEVLCVDALDLLVEEVRTLDLGRFSSDPSPQPSVVAHRTAIARRDPTPTPIVQPDRPDPTPTPMSEAHTDPEHDPTPTPMTER